MLCTVRWIRRDCACACHSAIGIMHACINAWPFATSTGKGKGRIQNQEHDRTCEWSRNSAAASRNYNNKKQGLIININIMLGSAGSSQCKHSSTALVAEICICMRALLLPPSPRLSAVLLSGSDQRPAGRLVRCPTLPIFLSCAPSVRCRHHIRIRSKSKSGPLHPSQSNHPCMQMQCESYRNRSVFRNRS